MCQELGPYLYLTWYDRESPSSRLGWLRGTVLDSWMPKKDMKESRKEVEWERAQTSGEARSREDSASVTAS